MAYIGTPAVDRFTASKAASVYSGNGSTVAFTLEHAVGSDEDILVSVDGVIQEPSVAYAVSSGTTLTFTSAPSNNAGNNIFVYYLFSTLGTVAHPTTSALSATSGTFSTTLGVTGNATLAGTLAVTGTSTLTGVTALGNTGSTVKSEGGAVTTIIAQGLAKSWINFNGTGTVAIKDSLNGSSITDRGASQYTAVRTNAMSSTNYAISGTMGMSSVNGTGYLTCPPNVAIGTWKTTSSNQIDFYHANLSRHGDDPADGAVIIHGDLA